MPNTPALTSLNPICPVCGAALRYPRWPIVMYAGQDQTPLVTQAMAARCEGANNYCTWEGQATFWRQQNVFRNS